MHISTEGISLLKKLLNKNPNDRISAKEALNDPWFDKFKISSLIERE